MHDGRTLTALPAVMGTQVVLKNVPQEALLDPNDFRWAPQKG